MAKPLSEMTLQELWQLFPIVLTEHKPYWADWFGAEASDLRQILPPDAQVHHIGSTAIDGIWAKPIVDILVEVDATHELAAVAERLRQQGYTVMATRDGRISLNKGYTPDGFAERVFHVHLQHKNGCAAEIVFRDYLNTHPETAQAYQALKLELWKRYEHDRDAYTAAKSDFVNTVLLAAQRETTQK